MTTRERLHELVDQLDDAAAEQLLHAATALTAPTARAQGTAVPGFVGSVHSGQADTSTRAKEILRAELGGRAAS